MKYGVDELMDLDFSEILKIHDNVGNIRELALILDDFFTSGGDWLILKNKLTEFGLADNVAEQIISFLHNSEKID